MTEIVVTVLEDPTRQTKAMFSVSSVSIEYYDVLPRDQIIPGVALLQNENPNSKADYINKRMKAGNVALSLPDPINQGNNLELNITRAEAVKVMVGDDESSAIPTTMLRLLCDIDINSFDRLVIGGQIEFVKLEG